MKRTMCSAGLRGVFVLLMMGWFGSAQAEVQMKAIDYQQGSTALEGFIAYDNGATGKHPGILIFPQFKGVSEHEREAAKRLAAMGYVAFVGDIYGKDVFHNDRKEAAVEAAKYFNDRPLVRNRTHAALAELMKNPLVDSSKVAAIGYCFGGMAALELGRSGADVLGPVRLGRRH
jgi:dienelactone hydrolase